MFKKRLAIIVLVIFTIAMFAGCGGTTDTTTAAPAETTAAPTTEGGETTEAPAETTAPAADFVPAAEIVAPPGKTLLSLPVDQVSEKPLRIATIMVQNNPFGAAVLVGQNAAKEILADRNCVVDAISVEDFDAQKWTSVIDNCIATGYDAITFFGLSEALKPVVDKGTEAGILMFSFNTEPGLDSTRVAFYGQDGFAGGQQCGTALVELMGGEGKYGIITGDFGVLGHELRRTGARDIFDKEDGMELIGEFENNDKAEEAYSVATNMLTAHPDLKGIYVTAGGPSGAAKAIEDAGMVDQVMLVCHDVLAESAPYVASGTIKACLDQDPFNQGYQPVVDAFNMLVTGEAPQEINWYDGVMATPETVEELFPELF